MDADQYWDDKPNNSDVAIYRLGIFINSKIVCTQWNGSRPHKIPPSNNFLSLSLSLSLSLFLSLFSKKGGGVRARAPVLDPPLIIDL